MGLGLTMGDAIAAVSVLVSLLLFAYTRTANRDPQRIPDLGLAYMITQHLHAVPVPPSERTELPIPATLEHLVLACLAKKPEERPQNARQLARSLETIDGMTWGEEEARRWWSQHHPPQVSTSETMTL